MQMALKVHELKPEVCQHPMGQWLVPDGVEAQFECGLCGKLMGDLEAGKPGWVDRLLKLWAAMNEAGRLGLRKRG